MIDSTRLRLGLTQRNPILISTVGDDDLALLLSSPIPVPVCFYNDGRILGCSITATTGMNIYAAIMGIAIGIIFYCTVGEYDGGGLCSIARSIFPYLLHFMECKIFICPIMGWAGGLKSTFTTSYIHTVVIFAALCGFLFLVSFLNPKTLNPSNPKPQNPSIALAFCWGKKWWKRRCGRPEYSSESACS